MLPHIPDASSAAYLIVERWASMCVPSTVQVTASAPEASVAVTMNMREPLNFRASSATDEVLVNVRPRCESITVRVYARSGKPRTISMPPRATQCLQALIGPCERIDVTIQGWKTVLPHHSGCSKEVPVTKLASALGRLALCYPQVAIICRIATANGCKKVTTMGSIPETERYTRVAKAVGPVSSTGLIVAIQDPKKKPETPLAITVQEVSINGIPVVHTRVHEYIDSVYKGVMCNQRGPGQKPQPPSYLLQLECSPEHVTFNGPALERSALIRMSHGVQQLLASVLLQAWGKIMPAAMLGKVQAAMEEPVPKAAIQPETAKHSPHAAHAQTQDQAQKDKDQKDQEPVDFHSGPYGHFVTTPVGHKNRSAALSPLGTVLKARRLLLHASPRVPAPDCPKKNEYSTGRHSSAAVKHREPKLKKQRQILKGTRKKKVVSAPCFSAALGHGREITGKHRASRTKRVSKYERSPWIESPGRADCFLHGNVLDDCIGRSVPQRCNADTIIKRRPNETQHTPPTSLCPMDRADEVGEQRLHEKKPRPKKRVRRGRTLQHSAPAPCTDMIQFPCSPLQQRHDYPSAGSMLLHSITMKEIDEFRLQSTPGKFYDSVTPVSESPSIFCPSLSPAQRVPRCKEPHRNRQSQQEERLTPSAHVWACGNMHGMLLPHEHSPQESPSVHHISPDKNHVQRSKRPKNFEQQRSCLLHSSGPCLPMSCLQDFAHSEACGFQELLEKASNPAKPLHLRPEDVPVLSEGFDRTPSPPCNMLKTYDSDAQGNPQCIEPSGLALLEDSFLQRQPIELPCSHLQSTPQLPTEGMQRLASLEIDVGQGYTSGGTGMLSSVSPSKCARAALRPLSLHPSNQCTQDLLHQQSGEMCNSFEDMPRQYMQYYSISNTFEEDCAALIESDPAANPLEDVTHTDGASSPICQAPIDVNIAEKYTPVSLTLSSPVKPEWNQDSHRQLLPRLSYALSDSPCLHGSPSRVHNLKCLTDYITPLSADKGPAALHRERATLRKQNPCLWSSISAKTDPNPCYTVTPTFDTILTSPQHYLSKRLKRTLCGTDSGRRSKQQHGTANQACPSDSPAQSHILSKHRKGRLKKTKKGLARAKDMGMALALHAPSKTRGENIWPTRASLYEQLAVPCEVAEQTYAAKDPLKSPISRRDRKKGKKANALHFQHIKKNELECAVSQDCRVKSPCWETVAGGLHNVHTEKAAGSHTPPQPCSHPTDASQSAAQNAATHSPLQLPQHDGQAPRSSAQCGTNVAKEQSLHTVVQQLETRKFSDAKQKQQGAAKVDQEAAIQRAESCPDAQKHECSADADTPSPQNEERSSDTPAASNERPVPSPSPQVTSQAPVKSHVEVKSEVKSTKAQSPVHDMSTVPSASHQEVNKCSSTANSEQSELLDQKVQENRDQLAPEHPSTLVTEFKRAARQHQQLVPVAHAGDIDKSGRICIPSQATCSGSVPTSVSFQNLLDGRVVGQAFRKLVLVYSGSVLLAVDQHAADERIRLESLQQQLCDALNQTNTPCKREHSPDETVKRPKAQFSYKEILSSHILRSPAGLQASTEHAMKMSSSGVSKVLKQWGFTFALHVDSRSETTSHTDTRIEVLAVPVICGRQLQPQDVFQFIAMEWAGGVFSAAALPQPVQIILQSVACRSAIMFGKTLLGGQMCELLSDLRTTRAPFQCAHGRPTTAPLVDVSLLQLGSDIRHQTVATRDSSRNRGTRKICALKGKLEQQLSKCQPLELTLCMARELSL